MKRVKQGDAAEMVGGYRKGHGRSYLAWYTGAYDEDEVGKHEAFGSASAARRWIRQQAVEDELKNLRWVEDRESGYEPVFRLHADTRVYFTLEELQELSTWA